MTRHARVAGAACLFLLAFVPSAGGAQEWMLDAYAGRAFYDPVSANLGTSNGVLGIRYAGAGEGWFYLSAAAPFGAEDPLWAATGLGRRLTLGGGRLSAGLDAGAHGYVYRHRSHSAAGAGATFHALPFVTMVQGAVHLELHSGVTQYGSTFSGQTTSRTLHDSGVRLILRGAFPFEFTGEGRNVRAEEGNYAYAGASASVSHGRGAIWAGVGRWLSDAIPDLSWGTGVSVALGREYGVWAAIRRESSHPLYWTDSRQSWNVGVSRRLGPAVGARAPAPASTDIAAGHVTIRVPLSEDTAGLFVAGDFTDWNPVAMVRSDGHWTVTLAVVPGFHHYAFRSADGRWFVPESVPGRRDDGFGGHVAVLLVP